MVCIYVCVHIFLHKVNSMCAYMCSPLTAWSMDLDRLVALQSMWALLTHTLLPAEGHPVSNWEGTPETKHTHKENFLLKPCRYGTAEIQLFDTCTVVKGSVHQKPLTVIVSASFAEVLTNATDMFTTTLMYVNGMAFLVLTALKTDILQIDSNVFIVGLFHNKEKVPIKTVDSNAWGLSLSLLLQHWKSYNFGHCFSNSPQKNVWWINGASVSDEIWDHISVLFLNNETAVERHPDPPVPIFSDCNYYFWGQSWPEDLWCSSCLFNQTFFSLYTNL